MVEGIGILVILQSQLISPNQNPCAIKLFVIILVLPFFVFNRQQKLAEREKRFIEQQKKKMEKEAQRMLKKEQKIAVKLS